jgi:hypothetical protein
MSMNFVGSRTTQELSELFLQLSVFALWKKRRQEKRKKEEETTLQQTAATACSNSS